MNELQKNEEDLIIFENSNFNQINEIFYKYLYLEINKNQDNFWLYRAKTMFSLINELLYSMKENINDKELELINENYYGYVFMQLSYIFSEYKEEIFKDDLYNKLKEKLTIKKHIKLNKI